MDYITPEEAAKKWNIGLRRVQYYCSENKISGAIRVGRQWMIPISAERPEDRRTKPVRQTQGMNNYHFPAFVFSDYYSSQSELSEDELSLLEAQKLTFQNRYIKSFDICKKMYAISYEPSVRFGAYCTNAYNSILLGLASEMNTCLEAMEKLKNESPAHEEDYRFLIAYIKFQISFNNKELKEINVEKLSTEALIPYTLTMMATAVFEKTCDSKTSYKTYEVFCRWVDAKGIAPAMLVAHGCLAHLCGNFGDVDGKIAHIKEVCRIGYEEGYVAILSKYSVLSFNEYLKELKKYHPSFSQKIAEIHERNLKNWKSTYTLLSGKSFLCSTSGFDNEVLLLLSNGLSNKSIAIVKRISVRAVSQSIDNLCQHFSLTTRAELVEHANQIFASSKDAIAE